MKKELQNQLAKKFSFMRKRKSLNEQIASGQIDDLYSAFGCALCDENDSAYFENGKLCSGYIDKRKGEFMETLLFWKVQNIYDREAIIAMIDDIETLYNNMELQ